LPFEKEGKTYKTFLKKENEKEDAGPFCYRREKVDTIPKGGLINLWGE